MSAIDPNPDLVALSERLRVVVESVGTQADAADLAGISLAQLKNYLSAKSVPSVFPVSRLCLSAGFSIEWLISGSGPQRTERMRPLPAHAEYGAISRSASARALARKESPAYARAEDVVRHAFGDDDEQYVRGLLRAAGIFDIFEPHRELDFALKLEPEHLFAMEDASVRAILREERDAWPMLAKATVASQRALALYMATAVTRLGLPLRDAP